MSKEKETRPTTIKTPEFRVSYPSVFRTKYNELSEKEEYTLDALFPKDTTDLKTIKKALDIAVDDKFGKNFKRPKTFYSPIKDGDEMDREEYEGHWVITLKANADYQPAVVTNKKDGDGKFIACTEREFYGGCWARAVVNAYAWGTKAKSGVSLGLGNIQKTRDDDRFGGGAFAPEADFDDGQFESDDDYTTDSDEAEESATADW